MAKKISKAYYQTLTPIEQAYVNERANVDDIPTIKLKISEAKKQVPGYTKIYGKGFVEDSTGKVYVWSGEDTRKYTLVPNVTDNPKSSTGEFSDEFFKKNPSKILGEAYMTTDRFGGKVMKVKGGMENLAGIDVNDEDLPQPKEGPFLSEVNQSVTQVITAPENSDNIEFAIKEQKERVAKQAIAKRTKTKKGETGDQLSEIQPELFTFEETLKKYNPAITDDEISVWVWYNESKGKRLQGGWNKYFPKASNDWFKSMIEKGYLCYSKSARYEPSFIYYSGNIAHKQSELLQQKAEIIKDLDELGIGDAQWQRQFDGLEEVRPRRLTLTAADPADRLIISPISSVAASFKIASVLTGKEYEEPVTLIHAFEDYIISLSDSDFELPVDSRDIRLRYLQGEADRSKRLSKEEKFENKKNARIEGDRLFSKFLYDELTAEDKSKLEAYWNGQYNSWRDVDYNKVPVAFEISKVFKRGDLSIRDAQREAVAFNSITGTGILAYDVGVGKTASAILTVGHLFTSGQVKRPLFIVPNPTYDKWIGEINGIYDEKGRMIGSGIIPQYKINDFKNLGVDYLPKLFNEKGELKPIEERTITVMTYEALYNIGFSEKSNPEFITELLSVLDDGSDSSKARDIALKIEKAKTTLGKVQAGTMIDFDELGFDYICIDEAHNFKNIFTSVKGKADGEDEKSGPSQYEIRGSVSDRGLKAFFITQYILNQNDGHGVNLLTATPFTNNPLEVYSMLALCGYKELKRRGINSLREFFDTYVKQTYEIVYGSDFQFKEKAVIKQWNNRISLQQLIFSFINYKSGEDAGIQRPNKIVLPLFKEKINGVITDLPEDRQISTLLKPTDQQRSFLKDIEAFVLKEASLSDLCTFEGAEDGCTANDELRSMANLSDEEQDQGRALRGLSFARAVTLSPYLYACNNTCSEDVNKPDFYKTYIETSPKLHYTMLCIKSVRDFHIKENTPVSCQIIYMDGGKSYFKYIKEYLVKKVGYEAHEIAFITSEVSQAKREDIKKAFLAGDIKIVIGTSTIKEGIDLQNKTTTLYNCWLDWRPTDVKQLEGRAWRFGNEWGNVRIVTPMLENSIDPFMFQKLEEKTARINDIFDRHGKKNVLDIEEFNPEELKLGLITDPVKKAKEMIRGDVKKVEIELKKLTSKIEGINEVVDLKKELSGNKKSIITRAQQKYAFLKENYSPATIETWDEEKEEYKKKKVNAAQHLKDTLGVSSGKDIVMIEQAIDFGRYYDNLTSQSEFKYDINDYRDAKRKLTNFEKSILVPRGLSLDDNIEKIAEDMKLEYEALEVTKKELESPENKAQLTERLTIEIKAQQAKSRSVPDRVKEFATLNPKVLTEKMIYAGAPKKEESKKEVPLTGKQEYIDAIEGLKTMMEFASKKEKKQYADAIEGLETMLEFA